MFNAMTWVIFHWFFFHDIITRLRLYVDMNLLYHPSYREFWTTMRYCRINGFTPRNIGIQQDEIRFFVIIYEQRKDLWKRRDWPWYTRINVVSQLHLANYIIKYERLQIPCVSVVGLILNIMLIFEMTLACVWNIH